MPYYSKWYEDFDKAGVDFDKLVEVTTGHEVAVYRLQIPPALHGYYVVVIWVSDLDPEKIIEAMAGGQEQEIDLHLVDTLWRRHTRNRSGGILRHGLPGQWVRGFTGEDIDPFSTTSSPPPADDERPGEGEEG